MRVTMLCQPLRTISVVYAFRLKAVNWLGKCIVSDEVLLKP